MKVDRLTASAEVKRERCGTIKMVIIQMITIAEVLPLERVGLEKRRSP
jgi:hypothetical protein